jgi:hypothetical protein
MERKHTPTPFEVTESGNAIEIQDAQGTSIIVIIDSGSEGHLMLAQKVTRAINSHDELLEALRKIAKLNKGESGYIASQAVARAEGIS